MSECESIDNQMMVNVGYLYECEKEGRKAEREERKVILTNENGRCVFSSFQSADCSFRSFVLFNVNTHLLLFNFDVFQ